VPSRVRALAGEALFAARASGFVALTTARLAELEVASHGLEGDLAEACLADRMRRYGRGLCALFGVDVRTGGIDARGYVPGRDADGRGRVFVVCHRSGLDVPITLAHLEGKHLSRADLAGWPVIGRAARRSGILFVDRSSRKSGAAAIASMIATIEAGRAIVIFPEGTTHTGDEVRPLKPGALTVARRTRAELVPVGLAYGGEDAAFVEESFAAHMRRVLSHRSTPVGLVVGEPLRASSNEDMDTLAARTRAAMQHAVDEARKLVDGRAAPRDEASSTEATKR
jgi:1-acyl-sn-glycerol-3-phosphate acyltransferase